MAPKAELYLPLRSWQMRLLRLHPAACSELLALECDLIIVNVIYFEGMLLRDSKGDMVIDFEALSYAWGDSFS
jgi:hypothetical protein